MKRIMAAAALTAVLGLAACGDGAPADKAAGDASAAAPAAADAATDTAATAEADAPVPLVVPSRPASSVPVFAALYPGATVTQPAVVAQGPAGPGGIVNFTTDASPETVIAFYRQRAEAAGLASVNSMSRGSARAYGAAAGDGSGSLLNVVADAVPDGGTHVQLSWTEAK